MITSKFQPMAISILILSLFIILGEASVVFHDYVFHRIGIDRNVLLSFLWLAPLFAAYFLVILSKKFAFWQLMLNVIFIAIVGSGAHYLIGLLGFSVDFSGWAGLKVVFKIYFVLGGIITFVGALLALVHLKLRQKTSFT